MPESSTSPPRALPPWAIYAASIFVAIHIGVIACLALAAPNGPWVTPFGDTPALGPMFAMKANSIFYPYYLEPLRMTHNYHFSSNRVLSPAVYLEARLKDERGEVYRTLKFPADKGNFWVRHRYGVLARELGGDEPVQAPRGEAIPAPGQKMRQVITWDQTDPKVWKLRELPEHMIPRDRPVVRPSEWSLMVARSLARYLLRENEKATSVELVRHSREQVPPAFMYNEGAPPGSFDELLSSFGEHRREN